MRKRKIKRYNGEEESFVEVSEVEEPNIKTRGLSKSETGEGLDVEGMKTKMQIASGKPAEEDGMRPGRNLALEDGGKPAYSYSRAQTEAKDEARRIKAEIERKKAAQKAKQTSKDEDERTAERRMKLKGEEYTARKIGAGYAKAASSVPSASPAEMERRKRMEKEQALETVSPETALIGGPGLKAVQKGAQALAAREAAKQVVKKRVDPSFRPIKDITPGPEKISMAPRRIGNEPLKLGMKKGGVVKKFTASSRADGIAQRGKTRGRIC